MTGVHEGKGDELKQNTTAKEILTGRGICKWKVCCWVQDQSLAYNPTLDDLGVSSEQAQRSTKHRAG